MPHIIERLRTYWRLGWSNVARVLAYKIGVKLRIHPVVRIKADLGNGPYFVGSVLPRNNLQAPNRWHREAELFSAHHLARPSIPDWHDNPLAPGKSLDKTVRWYKIPDFTAEFGDIKAIWEFSRFGWATAMAQRAAMGDIRELDALNAWIADWARNNPPFLGVNWKCGQEAAIRVIHIAAAALILNEVDNTNPELLGIVKAHCRRIAPTMGYAIGQANNHATSEAAALFIGGSWLLRNGDFEGYSWAVKGRHWLENRSKQLIESDGTFSQYSIVYHRLMLDTYSFSEVWRKSLKLNPFSNALVERLATATLWLAQMVEPRTGGAPNLGANDGALILHLTDAPFRDFRPSLSLASALFCKERLYADQPHCDQQLLWLGIETKQTCNRKLESRTLEKGGFHILRSDRAMALLRYPRFRFRPSQADLLHLDLWLDGQNILRDAGSYSYNPPDGSDAYFVGCTAHNTVQFDDRDQMPRLSRFLLGGWPEAHKVEPVRISEHSVHAAAGYTDYIGATHHRRVSLTAFDLSCEDRLSGSASKAIVRWRLVPGNWELVDNTARLNSLLISVSSDDSELHISLSKGFESLHYLEKQEIPVLEIFCSVPSTIVTKITF